MNQKLFIKCKSLTSEHSNNTSYKRQRCVFSGQLGLTLANHLGSVIFFCFNIKNGNKRCAYSTATTQGMTRNTEVATENRFLAENKTL